MLIPLKLLRDKPLQQQLYEQLRELIIASRLAAGTRMPSTRMLADQFAISRITALLTYERLIAEGYLRTIPAKGTFVQSISPRTTPPTGEPDATAERPVGLPDSRLFPAAKWRSLIRAAVDRLGNSLPEDQAGGGPPLRAAIARWLSSSRGLAIDADQIILAHGRQHALHIAAHLLLRPGSRCIIETPVDPAREMLLSGTGAKLTAIPVDEDGLLTDRLPEGPAAMALVTPEYQRPFGVVMGLPRRQALLAWAARSGAVVVEDDCDGEPRYTETDVPSLLSLDQDGIVLHVGDFAATLGPAVLTGYLVVPRRLIGPARTASRLTGPYAAQIEADALAALLDSGAYARHLHQIRKIYLNRRNALVRDLRHHFGEDTRISGISAGLYLAWTPPYPAAAVTALARRFGLDATRAGDRTVLLGFGVQAERQTETGIARLAAALTGAGDGLAVQRD